MGICMTKDKSKEAAVTPHDEELHNILANLLWESGLIDNKLVTGQITDKETYHKEIEKEIAASLAAINRLYLPRQKVVEAMKNPKGHVLGERFCDVCNVLAEILETLGL
jgi:hypothetical protein